jgi:acid phosphatase class B
MSMSDSFDIDDNLLFANSFMPTRRQRFVPFMNQQTFSEMRSERVIFLGFSLKADKNVSYMYGL